MAGWQYRYDGDPRARYLARAIDPETMEELGENPGDGSTWHDYAGSAIRNDLRIDDQGAVTVLRAYTRGLGLIESTDVVGEERLWYHGDMLGTTRMMTDEAGAADHRLRFTAFGEPLPLPGYGDPPGAPPQASTRYGFAGAWGYQHDALTSGTSAPPHLLHVGYRWYSPSIGRFIQRDAPLGCQHTVAVAGVDDGRAGHRPVLGEYFPELLLQRHIERISSIIWFRSFLCGKRYNVAAPTNRSRPHPRKLIGQVASFVVRNHNDCVA